jgi:cysteinyl-tRNA synthetase
MRLFDTARNAVVPFEPQPEVLMYTCGITPYDATHLGHAATFMAYDILQRRLIDLGHTVKCVRNVTDVDDPLFAKAKELISRGADSSKLDPKSVLFLYLKSENCITKPRTPEVSFRNKLKKQDDFRDMCQLM